MPECWDDMVQCELCDKWLYMSREGLKSAPEGEWVCTVFKFFFFVETTEPNIFY